MSTGGLYRIPPDRPAGQLGNTCSAAVSCSKRAAGGCVRRPRPRHQGADMTFHTTPRASAFLKALVLSVLVVAMLGFARPAAAAYKAQVGANTLTLTGNGASDKLALRSARRPSSRSTSATTAPPTSRSTARRSPAINVDAGGGDDQVRIDQTNGAFTDEAVDAERRRTATTRCSAATAHDVLIGGEGNDFVDGNRGQRHRAPRRRQRHVPLGSRRRQRHRRGPGRQGRARLRRRERQREHRRLRERRRGCGSPATSRTSRWT